MIWLKLLRRMFKDKQKEFCVSKQANKMLLTEFMFDVINGHI